LFKRLEENAPGSVVEITMSCVRFCAAGCDADHLPDGDFKIFKAKKKSLAPLQARSSEWQLIVLPTD